MNHLHLNLRVQLLSFGCTCLMLVDCEKKEPVFTKSGWFNFTYKISPPKKKKEKIWEPQHKCQITNQL